MPDQHSVQQRIFELELRGSTDYPMQRQIDLRRVTLWLSLRISMKLQATRRPKSGLSGKRGCEHRSLLEVRSGPDLQSHFSTARKSYPQPQPTGLTLSFAQSPV
eukprot:4242504-Amphidinium_carterae.1